MLHAESASGALLACTTWVGGFSTLAEKKSRRMELAHYCLARAIESFALCLSSWGYVPVHRLPKRTDVLLFSAAAAAIMHCYEDSHGYHRDVFKSKYLNVLDFVFGNTGMSSWHAQRNALLLHPQLQFRYPGTPTPPLHPHFITFHCLTQPHLVPSCL